MVLFGIMQLYLNMNL